MRPGEHSLKYRRNNGPVNPNAMSSFKSELHEERFLASQPKMKDLNWYEPWLKTNFNSLPKSVTANLRSLPDIFTEVTNFAKAGNSISDIATHLLDMDLISCEDREKRRQVAISIAFAMLGWLTMLYEPAIGTCPPQQLAIADVLDGYTGQAFMKVKQDLSRIKRPLPEFLLGFGLMLPPENLCISGDQEDCQAFEKFTVVRPEEFNVALFQSLGDVSIKWVDVIAPHLEFDKATNTVFLFRYPSFCTANIPLKEESNDGKILYSCAAQYQESIQWASEADITQLLHEILLSYRLLFGQTKESRKVFQSMTIFDKSQAGMNDLILPQLCSSKASPLEAIDRDFYRLNRDFPILRSRIAILQSQMSNLKPRGWKQLWKDKRDSAQWLTFWAVILIGGAGILLSLAQVVLQAAQLAGAPLK